MEAAISYARASQDRTGEELSVSRQHEDHRGLAGERGVRLVAELTDNDVSAAGRRKRPGFEAALTMVKRGEATVIIATDMSRLTRGKALDEARLLELGLGTGLKLWFKRAPDLDLQSAAGRLTASILIAAARHEIEQKSERQRRSARQAAEMGRWIGGRRPFGYEKDGMTVRPAEAQAVVAAYEAVLAGVPVAQISADWNAQGLLTPQLKRDGSPSTWTPQTLRPLLLNPRYAGLRSHVTEKSLEQMNPRKARLAGIIGPAAWNGLVAEETWRAVVEILTDPSRTTNNMAGQALLTGVARCGVCGATVHRGGAPARQGRAKYPTYRCRAAMGHLGRAAEPVDAWVTEAVLGLLGRSDAQRLLVDQDRPDADQLRGEAQAIRARLDGLATLFADGVLSEIAVRRQSAVLKKRLGEIEDAQAASGRGNLLKPLIGATDMRAAWSALGTDRQRAIIGSLAVVTLLPPGRGRRAFRPESIVIEWID